MLTVKDHNDRAAPAYAAHQGEYWIESLRDGRHVLVRALAAKDRNANMRSSSACRPSPGTCVFSRRSVSRAPRCSIS